MQAGVEVVDGVESVVEGEIVEKRIREVARKVVLGRHVAAVVLEQIERQDAVLGIELRDQRKPDPAAPVIGDQHSRGAEDDHLLQPPLLDDGPILASLSLKIQFLVVASHQDDVPKEQEAIQQIPLIMDLGGTHYLVSGQYAARRSRLRMCQGQRESHGPLIQ